jgi:hypothetical protein
MSVDPEMECLHIGYDQMPWQNKAIIDKGNIYTLAMNATVYGNWILANSKTTSFHAVCVGKKRIYEITYVWYFCEMESWEWDP